MNLSLYDFTTKKQVVIPALPTEFRVSTPIQNAVVAIIGAAPMVQNLARGGRSVSFDLLLHGEPGVDFYHEIIEPTYGTSAENYRPHQVRVSWGTRASETFVGIPNGTIEDVRTPMGEQIFSVKVPYTLLEVITNRAAAARIDKKAARPTAQQTHTVKSGETLSRIAAQYGLSLEKLLLLNPSVGTKPNAGTVLVVRP